MQRSAEEIVRGVKRAAAIQNPNPNPNPNPNSSPVEVQYVGKAVPPPPSEHGGKLSSNMYVSQTNVQKIQAKSFLVYTTLWIGAFGCFGIEREGSLFCQTTLCRRSGKTSSLWAIRFLPLSYLGQLAEFPPLLAL